jgi:mRNA-degrading endonuclease RelE of RelBE toxin-antitoxin system
MKYEFKYTATFEADIKKLNKKYPNILKDVYVTLLKIDENTEVGQRIPGLNKRIYKIRVPSTDMKKGKRGSYRIIYYVLNGNNEIILITIYVKSRQENIIPSQIESILKKLK